MTALSNWAFLVAVCIVVPVLCIHIAQLLDDRYGVIRKSDRWITDGVRPEDEVQP